MSFVVKQLTIEVQGRTAVATPVSDEMLVQERSALLAAGRGDECKCGEEYCSRDGFLWVCAIGRDGKCQWFSSDWRCNP